MKQGRKVKRPKNYCKELVDYILEHELQDYLDFCEDNDLNTADLKGNDCHIYAVALLAKEEIDGDSQD